MQSTVTIDAAYVRSKTFIIHSFIKTVKTVDKLQLRTIYGDTNRGLSVLKQLPSNKISIVMFDKDKL